MKSRGKNFDVVHHGMVLLSDGKGRGRPARMELTKDVLTIQIPCNGSSVISPDIHRESPTDQSADIRQVKLRKRDGGLGLSIKGGHDSNQQVPIVVSKIFPNTPAEESGMVNLGDAIIEINGQLVEGKTHDEVVQMLKDVDEEVELSLRHFKHIDPYLRPASSLRLNSGGALNRLYEPNTWKSSLKAQYSILAGNRPGAISQSSTTRLNDDTTLDGWQIHCRIPLPMAFITRYLWGTDKLRNNAFEVRAVDGTSSGIIHCEDQPTLDQWIKHIQTRITSLNYKSIKLSNRYLHKSEQITYIGWVSERLPEEYFEDPRLHWEPRFVILRGSEVCIFESPPLNSDDLNKCITLYKIYDTAFKVIDREKPTVDRRNYCFWLETSANSQKHYFSLENRYQFNQFETAYHRCLHSAVNNLQTRTFACSFEGRPSGLVIDLKQGISLYDITTKRYTWQYRFCDLDSSSDDGKIRLRLIFRDTHDMSENQFQIRDIESDEVSTIVFTMHSFYVSKVFATEPDYLKTIPLI